MSSNKINSLLLAVTVAFLIGSIFYIIEPELFKTITIWIISGILAGLLWYPFDSLLSFLQDERSQSRQFKAQILTEIPVIKEDLSELKTVLNRMIRRLDEIEDRVDKNNAEILGIEKGLDLISPRQTAEMVQVCQNLIGKIETFIIPIPDRVYYNWNKQKITLSEMVKQFNINNNIPFDPNEFDNLTR